MSYFRPDLHRYFASQFVDNILNKKTALYYFLGRTYAWGNTTTKRVWNEETSSYETVTVTDDTPPELPNTAYINDTEIRDNITYVRKLESNNITLSIRRIPWKKGTMYYQWDNTKEMNETNADKSLKTPYYVINSNYSVYKCLYNNHGAPSTEEPLEKSYGVLQTDDGYLWKYMYSIQKIQLTRFLSGDYIPCQRAINESFYNLGAVESVVVKDGGQNYKSGTMVNAIVESPHMIEGYINEEATAFSKEWLLDAEGNVITPSVSLIYIVKTEGDFKDKHYRFDSSSSSYIDTLDSGVTAELSLNIDDDGTISSVTIVKAGRGYNSDNPPKITIDDQYHTGKGKYSSNTSAILEANIRGGKLDTVTIIDPGIGYSNEALTKLAVIGDGTGCVLKPILKNGKIVSVDVVNGGTGYTHVLINIITAKEQGVDYGNASLVAVLGGTTISSDQSVVEQTTIDGAIYAVEVTDGGNHWTTPQYDANGVQVAGCSVKIDGDGEGCVCRPIIVDGAIQSITIGNGGKGYTSSDSFTAVDPQGTGSGFKCTPNIGTNGEVVSITVNDTGLGYSSESYITVVTENGEGLDCLLNIEDGVIRYINVLSYGKNYTRGTVVISDTINRIDTNEITYKDASAYAIISPINGHGRNAVTELNASTATLYLVLKYSDLFGNLNNEFRQFGVLSNLTSFKSLTTTVYGIPVILNDTNWLFNSNDGLISQKLLEPIVTVYDPSDSTDDGVQFGIVKSTSSTATTIANHIDYINMIRGGSDYDSYYDEETPTTVVIEDSTGTGCELIPHIKGSVKSIKINDSGYGFRKTLVRVLDDDEEKDAYTYIALDISSEGAIVGASVIRNASDDGTQYYKHNRDTTSLEIYTEGYTHSGTDAEIKPVIGSTLTGLIEIKKGETSVTGTDTDFETEVTVGDSFYVLDDNGDPQFIGIVAEISNSLNMTLYDTVEEDMVGATGYVNNNGKIVGVNVTQQGTSYMFTDLTVLDKSAVGSGCFIEPEITNGVLYEVKVIYFGADYSENTTITLEDPNRASGCVDAVLETTIIDGKIDSVEVVNGGTGYTSSAYLEIHDPSGQGFGANLEMTIHDGLITGGKIIVGGNNYIEKSTSVTVNTNVYYFGHTYSNPNISLLMNGSIESISVVSSGHDYSEDSVVKIMHARHKETDPEKQEESVYAEATPIISSTQTEEVCLEPMDEDAENYTVTAGCVVKYVDGDDVQFYTITDVIDSYIPIRNKDVTNTVASEENLCDVITLKNYDYDTGKYPGLQSTDSETGDLKNNDIIITIAIKTTSATNYVQYRVVNVSGRNILVQPLTYVPRTITPEGDMVEGDVVTYSYTSDSGIATSVRTVVEDVVSRCTIDKYSGELLYVANTRPLEFFEGKTTSVQTNIYF